MYKVHLQNIINKTKQQRQQQQQLMQQMCP